MHANTHAYTHTHTYALMHERTKYTYIRTCTHIHTLLHVEYKMSFSGRNTIDVLPIVHGQAGGTTELKPFSLAVKNPMKNIIELCLNLSTNEAVLPVLVTLMLHCKGDPEKSNFQASRHCAHIK